jgi:hypothetical protein
MNRDRKLVRYKEGDVEERDRRRNKKKCAER